VKTKREIDTKEVLRIVGTPSQVLTDRCPDLLQVFPSSPCTNRGCPYVIAQPGYMNCTFVAAEAGGEHTLEEIGEALSLTRERVRQIEAQALIKFRKRMAELDGANASVHQPNMASRNRSLNANGQLAQSADKADVVPAVHGRKLAQSRR
jgi:hypothetical protein